MFADDTLIYTTGATPTETQQKLQSCIDVASKWYTDNNLLLNAGKSNTMCIQPLKKGCNTTQLDIMINGQQIECH